MHRDDCGATRPIQMKAYQPSSTCGCMKTRRVSSYSSNGREYPQIRLSGNWLKEHGYYPGTEFEVTAEDDILLIHPRSDAPPRPRYAVEDEARPSNPHFDITEYRVELSPDVSRTSQA